MLEDGTDGPRRRAWSTPPACGPTTSSASTAAAEPVHIRPAKGVHVTVPRAKVPADIAVVVPVPGDRRSIFVVPWGDHVYLGTTDTDYDGPIENPACTADDVAYMLSAINAATTETVTNDDVLGTWAGLRPLIADAKRTRTADLSRRHSVTTSPAGPNTRWMSSPFSASNSTE